MDGMRTRGLMDRDSYRIETIPAPSGLAKPRSQEELLAEALAAAERERKRSARRAAVKARVSEGWGSPEITAMAEEKSEAEREIARQQRDIAEAAIPLDELLGFCLYQVKPLLPNLKPVPDYETYRQMLETDGSVAVMCYFATTRALVNRVQRAKPVVAGVVLESSAWNVAGNDAVITLTAKTLTGRRLRGLHSGAGINAFEALGQIKELANYSKNKKSRLIK